jgi:hypothetical protein
MEKKTLLISSWNIQGHTSKGHDKFSDPEFIAHVKDSDIKDILNCSIGGNLLCSLDKG